MSNTDDSRHGGKRASADLRRRQLLGGMGLGAAASLLPAAAAGEARSVRRWDNSADVVVVGSGAAGTAAAIEARRAGAEAIVLESLPKLGGSSAMSGGGVYLGGGTSLQKACGFEDSLEAMRDYILAASGRYAQRDKVDVYCDGSLDHFQWLLDNGVVYREKFSTEKEIPGSDASLYYSGNERTWPYRDLARPAPRGHVPGVKGWTGGRSLMEALIASAKRLGARYQTEVGAERLLRESDGRIGGLQAVVDGKAVNIRARKGVVLAAGGFIHNREMLTLYAPELANCSVPWGNAGDLGIGIQMGLAVGAATLQMHHGFAVLPLYEPTHVLKGIVVNQYAQRFIPEEGYHGFLGHAIAFHQQGKAWLITDAESQYGYEDYRVREVARARSIAELERQLGFAERALVESVAYFNRHASKGRDPLFHKHPDYLQPLRKPPYIAYDLSVDKAFVAAHTFGGLRTNTHAQVMDARGETIPGLYAAGRTSAGLPVAPYIGSGISVGDASFFGRRAGTHAASV